MPKSNNLSVFLCYASQDRPAVYELYNRLKSEDWINPWMDKEKILPGQDWNFEIGKAIQQADSIIVCLSQESVMKEGYIQKEFKTALNLAEEKPEGTIFIIPLRLDNCQPPSQFQKYQWVDYYSHGTHEKLLESLRLRANSIKLKTGKQTQVKNSDSELQKIREMIISDPKAGAKRLSEYLSSKTDQSERNQVDLIRTEIDKISKETDLLGWNDGSRTEYRRLTYQLLKICSSIR